MYDGQRQSSTILTVLGSDTDFGSLQSALHPHRTQLFRGRTLADARRLLASEAVDVVVTEDGLPDNSGWKDVLDASRSDARPVIVTSRRADEFLWAEVLNLGGFDVLKQPFEKEEVLWVLGSALRHRDRERAAQRGNTDSAVSAEDVDASRERVTVAG